MTQNREDHELSFDDHEKMRKNGVNFNLDWLQTVLPVNLSTHMMFTQQTQSLGYNTQANTANEIPVMLYECPRCLLNESELLSDDSASHDTSQSLSQPPALLDYIYRFWFVLRDATSTLDPCLIEGDLAERFLHFVSPEKFYTIQDKAHQVYKTIHEQISKKFSFTIETFNLASDIIDPNQASFSANSKVADLNVNTQKKLNILYKIVDLEEIIPLKQSSKKLTQK